MHRPFINAGIENLDPEAIIQLDRALRRARERVLAAGTLSDPMWAVLIELAHSDDGLSFEALDAGLLKHFGRTMLLGCLSNLQEAGLADGQKQARGPLLSHIRITRQGRQTIELVLNEALGILRR
jgi:hypothetical protein